MTEPKIYVTQDQLDERSDEILKIVLNGMNNLHDQSKIEVDALKQRIDALENQKK